MPIDAASVGANQRQIVVVGDPTTASGQGSVLQLADATNLAGGYGLVVGAVSFVRNASLTYDVARAAPGITGIPAVSTEGTKATYCVGIIGITPAATPTDIVTIYGSGSKTIRVTRIEVSGMATAAATVDLQLIRRSTADTGGTSTNPAAVAHDTNNPGATAVVTLYSANPTLGTGVGTVRGGKLNLGAAGAAGSLIWDFGTRNGQGMVLRTAAQGLAINWNGAAVPSGGVLCASIEWVEDAS